MRVFWDEGQDEGHQDEGQARVWTYSHEMGFSLDISADHSVTGA